MDNKWRVFTCPTCSGSGVVSVYSAYDFEGPGPCNDCGESGRIFIRPSGHCFAYPGGPAAGMWSKDKYQQSKPYVIPNESPNSLTYGCRRS